MEGKAWKTSEVDEIIQAVFSLAVDEALESDGFSMAFF